MEASFTANENTIPHFTPAIDASAVSLENLEFRTCANCNMGLESKELHSNSIVTTQFVS